MKKKIFVCLLAVVIVTMLCAQTVSAAEITPYWSNTSSTTFSFSVLNPGVAHIGVSYYGNSDFLHAKLTVEIQKRFLGVFWKTVDIGLENNKWVVYSGETDDTFYNTFPVDGTGTYRAKITLEVAGKSGVTDVIEDTIVSAYD